MIAYDRIHTGKSISYEKSVGKNEICGFLMPQEQGFNRSKGSQRSNQPAHNSGLGPLKGLAFTRSVHFAQMLRHELVSGGLLE
jgi:hypothetical protein